MSGSSESDTCVANGVSSHAAVKKKAVAYDVPVLGRPPGVGRIGIVNVELAMMVEGHIDFDVQLLVEPMSIIDQCPLPLPQPSSIISHGFQLSVGELRSAALSWWWSDSASV